MLLAHSVGKVDAEDVGDADEEDEHVRDFTLDCRSAFFTERIGGGLVGCPLAELGEQFAGFARDRHGQAAPAQPQTAG